MLIYMRAILVDVIPPKIKNETAKQRLDELASLTATFGGLTVIRTFQRRTNPDYKTYVGSGKLQQIIDTARELNGELLILNNTVKPRQLFAIQERLRPQGLAVWDRIDLILHIFQKHATTREAKLQIQLAAIRHMGPRIFDMGIEMGQQGAGIGTRGIGEKNTEIMKRHLRKRELRIQKQLKEASRSRFVHRYRRKRVGLLTASIVGYTNAGKSSLLNALTRKGAYVADKLFATLDTRVGKLWLSNIQKPILLSDTIGFIQHLPSGLIDAFRSTLEETIDADLLLHVIDASDPEWETKKDAVELVFKELGVHEKPCIDIFNKIDLLPNTTASRQEENASILVSAKTGKDLPRLTTAIENYCRLYRPISSV